MIQTEPELTALSPSLREASLVAVDTEAAGFHRYSDAICLLQVTVDGSTYLVDTLAVGDLGPVATVLQDPSVETVLHGADYDIRLLHRDFGARVEGLFDTMIAAQFLGESALGLAALLERHLGIKLEKRFQRADWARRPLPEDMLAYAAEDTRWLSDLHDRLDASLRELGRREWAAEEFRVQEQVVEVEPEDTGDDLPDFLRVKGARDLGRRQLAVLGALYDWRDRTARELDRAPFRVLGDDALIELARHAPGDAAALGRVPRVPGRLPTGRRDGILTAVRTGEAVPERDLPRLPPRTRRPPPDPELDRRVDRLKAARDAAARRLELDRGFLMPRAQLERVAAAEPDSLEALSRLPGVRRWQVEALGQELLDALAE